MPFIAPRFISNNIPVQRASTPINRPPWVRGPVPNNNDQQGNDGASFVAPWRKNIRKLNGQPSSGDTVNSPVCTTAPDPVAVGQSQQQFLPQSVQPTPPTKTSSLQINLKSVKKPENAPQQQQQQSNVRSVAPPVGKVTPIPILILKDNNLPVLRPTTFPIKQELKPTTLPFKQELRPVILPITQEPIVIPDHNMPTKSAGGGPTPPAPPPPPNAPPPPPPPVVKQAKIEMLRKPAKKRPDWAGMMKEIEKGRVLNHVQCNDRSKPMLTKLKSRGRFVYESEAKPANKHEAVHNRLLNEITKGVKLKKVHCNDRSRPILTGLRVRRQSSVAEGEGGDGVAAPLLDPVNELAFLDIDDLRDELQSAKQLLQAEVESKHGLERKTRDQKCQIIAMEAEIETLKAKLGIIPEDEVSALAKSLEKSDSKTFKHLKKSSSSLWKSPSSAGLKKSRSGLAKQSPSDANVNKLDQQNEDDLVEMNEYEEEIVSLKEAVQHAKKQADEMEAKYKEAMAKLESVQSNFEDSEQRRTSLEKQVETLQAQQDGSRPIPPVIQTAERTTQTEEQILEKTSASYSRQQSSVSNAGDYSESEEEEESDVEVDEEAIQKKKHERELILWQNKVKSLKDKQNISRLERKNLKSLQRKLEAELKDANKRHKKLQKEVDKMAKMLKDVEKDSDEEDEEEEVDEAEEETEEEESEEEDDSETNDEEDVSSEEDDEKASYDDRLAVFNKRVKKRENVLTALRKGNYLLRANIDRLKDDLEVARLDYHDLEHELHEIEEM